MERLCFIQPLPALPALIVRKCAEKQTAQPPILCVGRAERATNPNYQTPTHKIMTAISIIIPVHNAGSMLSQCLRAVFSSTFTNFECVVVDDGSTDQSNALARQFPVTLFELEGGPHGPAQARNMGAEIAEGEILFFIDADVNIYPDTLSKIADAFDREPQLDALFGSYDGSPAESGFLSQYRNLLHHFIHQRGRKEASTFWSGCGAIRRTVFLEAGGFDVERFSRPSVEDIELGYRLISAGHRIRLAKDIQVKHLKQWTLWNMLKTDIFRRAFPWACLIFEHKNLPNDLNVNATQRVSAFTVLGLLIVGLRYLGYANFISLPLFALIFMLVMGGWRWEDGPSRFQISPSARFLASLLLLVTGWLAYDRQIPPLLIPAGVLLATMWLGDLLPRLNRSPSLLYPLQLASLALAAGIVLYHLPLTLTIPMTLLLGIIMLLNGDLYRFFARKHGLGFALGVLPFQMLYYLYSSVAFGLSGLFHSISSLSSAKKTTALQERSAR